MAGAAVRAWRAPASLGAKLVLMLTAVGVAGALGAALLLASVLVPSFGTLERQATQTQAAHVRAALDDLAEQMEHGAQDRGRSDTLYRALAPGAAHGALPAAMPAGTDADAVAVIAADGGVRLLRTQGRPDWARMLATVAPRGRARGFYLRMGDAVVAVGIAPVRRADGSGAARGQVVIARRLTAARLSARLGAAVTIDTRHDAPGTPAAAVAVAGPDGRTVARVRFGVARDITTLGRRLLLLAIAGSVLLLLLVLTMLRRMIGEQVLAPLALVERHMERVRASGSLAPLRDDGRRDEIGALGRSFNAMLRQLHDLREQNEVQSFALGRSESAVAVMHNVRNALSPVSAVLSHDDARGAPVDAATVLRAVRELAEGDVPAERRARLAAFVAQAVTALEEARGGHAARMTIGRTALRHVLDIIGAQQAAAHERPHLAPCDRTAIVAQNAAIARYAAGAGAGAGGGDIAFSYPATPCAVRANRVILSQVIGNLFANAAEAVAASGRARGTITVTLAERGDTVELRITDDGEGFDPAIGATLFQRGFSTRAHKSGGLGLHWCANSMAAMDGSLRLDSAGPGQGATATLTLAAAPMEHALAA
jgi:two-component system, OmpR family, sensor kinase